MYFFSFKKQGYEKECKPLCFYRITTTKKTPYDPFLCFTICNPYMYISEMNPFCLTLSFRIVNLNEHSLLLELTFNDLIKAFECIK